MNVLLGMFLSACCALGLVYVFELIWINRPPGSQHQWAKRNAMRFMWGLSGIVVALGQFPVGAILGLAALPVCLAHLRLVDRQPNGRVDVSDVMSFLISNARKAIRTLMERTRGGPRR